MFPEVAECEECKFQYLLVSNTFSSIKIDFLAVMDNRKDQSILE